jgi:AraC-like DNA-binding protein
MPRVSFEPKSATFLEGRFVWAQYAPHASLAPWISSYWTLRAEGPHVVRTLPDACIDLTLQLYPDARAYMAAADTRASDRPSREPLHLVGARLLPGTAALLGVAVETLGDGWTPLDTLLPGDVVEGLLRDVTAAKDVLAQIAALDAFFAERLLNGALDPRLGKALREVFARRGDISIAELARCSGTHTRTLARLFDQAVGLSPKRFVRIVRLQAALRALPAGDSWAGVAMELGYCDQAHFIREVRELFGTTPREIMRLTDQTR